MSTPLSAICQKSPSSSSNIVLPTQTQKDYHLRNIIVALFSKSISQHDFHHAVEMFKIISCDGVKSDILRLLKENKYSYESDVVEKNANHVKRFVARFKDLSATD